MGDYSLRAHRTRPDGSGVQSERIRVTEGTFDDLYRSHWNDLCKQLRKAFGSGPPEPEDVAQAAFERLAALEDPGRVRNPKAFLLVTARNIVYDHKRRSGRHFEYARSVLSEHSGPSLDDLSPERLLIEKQRFQNIRAAVESLPYKQKVVLRLHRELGYTYNKIAEETGWSYGDVYRQMEYALAALSGALKR
ncbi:MAG: sigma-70 family RNA polymerase sigma factor [Alphaproteobacteria bacterium]|uniref:RNA polymerase sigma factor n=1 Tax=Hyphomonas sp. TaxID=87 RepID=UPI0030026F02|nr:sigma-70 family RNA polymerase sigma factor [Alphaproteobacteria bacterium]